MVKKILCIGNPVLDIISTPKARSNSRILSGCSTNACLAIKNLGENCTLVGNVGSDYFDFIQNDLKARGISFIIDNSRETGGFRLVYDEKGDRELTVIGVADPISLTNSLFPNGTFDFVLLGPIMSEISVDLVKAVINKVSCPIMLDPQGLLRGIQNGNVHHYLSKEYSQISKMCQVVKANEIETKTITGINPRTNPERAVVELKKSGCDIAITTIAESGSIIYDGNNIIKIPAYKTNAIDPTGAGDTYAAGFMIRYLEIPNRLQDVGYFASAVASVMVENSGPDFYMTRDIIEDRVSVLERI